VLDGRHEDPHLRGALNVRRDRVDGRRELLDEATYLVVGRADLPVVLLVDLRGPLVLETHHLLLGHLAVAVRIELGLELV
jgi:hypothetical protein